MFISEASIPFKDAIDKSLNEGDACSSQIIYQVQYPPSLDLPNCSPSQQLQQSLDQEHLQMHQERQPLYVNIEARKMEYFKEPVIGIFMRDVT